MAVLKVALKCSFTKGKLRFFSNFHLALATSKMFFTTLQGVYFYVV